LKYIIKLVYQRKENIYQRLEHILMITNKTRIHLESF